MNNFEFIKTRTKEEMVYLFTKDIKCENCLARDFCLELHSKEDSKHISCGETFLMWLDQDIPAWVYPLGAPDIMVEQYSLKEKQVKGDIK